MRIVFLGDIIGQAGCAAVIDVLPAIRKTYEPDVLLANVENTDRGFGVKRDTVKRLIESGIDACTGGNHMFDAGNQDELFADADLPLIRPLNWPGAVPGSGSRVLHVGHKRILLLNVLGKFFMYPVPDNPFTAVEEALKAHANETFDAVVLDVHAEATSEKRALAEQFDGRINLVVGTHTHVQTADNQTLPRGTGFLTDMGMCGPRHSIIGFDRDISLLKFRTSLPIHVPAAEGPCDIHGCVADIEEHRTSVRLLQMEAES